MLLQRHKRKRRTCTFRLTWRVEGLLIQWSTLQTEYPERRRLSALLSYKLKQEYSEICGFVNARMSIAIVRSNSLPLRVPWGKWARIRQQPELADGLVMAMIAHLKG